jgi:hypothetical protein
MCPEGAPDLARTVITKSHTSAKPPPCGATHQALRSPDFASHRSFEPTDHKLRRAGCPRRRPRPRIRPRGVIEYWSVGVLRQLGIAPRVRGVGNAFRAHSL